MNIINMDGKLSGLDIDLSNEYSNLPKAKYVSNQNILNGIKHYTITDTWNDEVLKPDSDYNISFIGLDGNLVKISMKEIVQNIYDSEYCIDEIEDEPDEFWFFIDLFEISSNRDHPIHSPREQFLASCYGRVKSYEKYKAFIMEPYPKSSSHPATDYQFVYFTNYDNLKVYIHRLVAQYINALLVGMTPAEFNAPGIQVHHMEDKTHNECFNLMICRNSDTHRQIEADKRTRERAREKYLESLSLSKS